MKTKQSHVYRLVVFVFLILSLTVLSNRIKADTGTCGGVTVTLPFTDVMGNLFFCSIAGAYFSGLTNGTTPTTYAPGANVLRDQMAAFITRTMDQSLKRSGDRALTEKWWTPQTATSLTLTTVASLPDLVEFDGTDVWVANNLGNSVMRIRTDDGKLLDTWTGATTAFGIAAALGRIFVTAQSAPGKLYVIDPTLPAGIVTTLSSSLGNFPSGIAFDGSRIWTANVGSVSIVSLNPTSVTTVSTGFNGLVGILYDGANIWVTDIGDDTIKKLDSNGNIVQTINVGDMPQYPVFDGTNIWVPNENSPSVTVVRVKDSVGNALAAPFVLATLTANGLNSPITAAFDGERILVTNFGGNSVSLWKASDLTPLSSFPTGAATQPFGACSDGLNFWMTLRQTNKLARF